MPMQPHQEPPRGQLPPALRQLADSQLGMVAVRMSEITDLRERITRLEGDVKHATKAIDGMVEKLDELHDLLNEARGGWKVGMGIVGLVGVVGGFLIKWAGIPH